jgi:hypothetical protein
MIFVQLETLTDRPFGRHRGQPVTAGDYWQIVDHADSLDWHWSVLSTPDESDRKFTWHNQFCLNRNPLVTMDYCDVASGNLLISRDLNLCRMFCCAGGRALWVDHPHFRDVSGTNAEFHRRCAEEAINEALAG